MRSPRSSASAAQSIRTTWERALSWTAESTVLGWVALGFAVIFLVTRGSTDFAWLGMLVAVAGITLFVVYAFGQLRRRGRTRPPVLMVLTIAFWPVVVILGYVDLLLAKVVFVVGLLALFVAASLRRAEDSEEHSGRE